MVLEEFIGHLWGKKRWGDGVMRDLDVSLRAQGPVHPAYDTMLERCGTFAYFGRLLGCGFSVVAGGFLATSFLARHRPPPPASRSIMQTLLAVPPRPVMLMFGCASACMSMMTKMQYYHLQYLFAKIVLNNGDEHMKMELAKIILNNHNDDKSLVEAVKRHFVADHLFSDQHQDKPLLRWRERGSYVDSALLDEMKEYEAALDKMNKMMKEYKAALKKMMKEYEANNSDDGAKSSVNTATTEINNPPEHIGGTILTRRELKSHQRSHRRRRHADKTAVL